jgi:hypothetical protein
MPFRFQRRAPMGGGSTLNIGKRGLNSVSFGRRGARFTIGRYGTRMTVGLPGTGLSYTSYSSHSSGRKREPRVNYSDPTTLPRAPTIRAAAWCLGAFLLTFYIPPLAILTVPFGCYAGWLWFKGYKLNRERAALFKEQAGLSQPQSLTSSPVAPDDEEVTAYNVVTKMTEELKKFANLPTLTTEECTKFETYARDMYYHLECSEGSTDDDVIKFHQHQANDIAQTSFREMLDAARRTNSTGAAA